MTRLILFGTGLLGLAAPVALGQGLSERINHYMQSQARAPSGSASKGHLLGTLLYTDLSVRFDKTPARDAINHLQTLLGINIIGRYSDDRSGFGIDPETEITLDAADKPALTVLELVLAQCETEGEPVTWQLRDGFVEVGTKDRLAAGSAKEVRYYPIRDLLFQPPHFNNAPKLDLDSALNQGNNQGGGGGFGGGGGGGGGGLGGGGGGGGGGGSGGSGGGSIFSEADEDADRITEAEQAQEVVDLILETIEPEGWSDNGGDWATVRYYQGTLIIRAPDFIHRQIGGYPFAIRPVGGTAAAPGNLSGQRYVTFTGSISNVELAQIRAVKEFGGAAGGSN
jgi:uncharacterized membrane protein YgcG